MSADRHSSGEPVRTLVFGSGAFAVPILDEIAANPDLQVVGVVAAPDRPTGRHAASTSVPVARRARELTLPLLQPTRLRSPDAVAEIMALRPEFGVLADYGQIVPSSILAIPAHGILNVHPSALPRHRGAIPIAATIMAGDSDAAVTLIRMDAGLDTGPIVAQEAWPLAGTETAATLEAEAARRGADLLRRTVGDWLAGEMAARAQTEVGATLTRPLRREDGRLDPTRPAAELERHVRAHGPWPGSFVDTSLGRLIVQQAEVVAARPADTPGGLVAHDDGLALTTADGRLRLMRAQLAGRRPTDGASLRRGAPGIVGQSIGLR